VVVKAYQYLCLLHLLEMVNQGDVLDVVSGEDLPEGTNGIQDLLVGFLENLKLPLKFSIARHIHGVVVVFLSHTLHFHLLQLEDLVLLSH